MQRKKEHQGTKRQRQGAPKHLILHDSKIHDLPQVHSHNTLTALVGTPKFYTSCSDSVDAVPADLTIASNSGRSSCLTIVSSASQDMDTILIVTIAVLSYLYFWDFDE